MELLQSFHWCLQNFCTERERRRVNENIDVGTSSLRSFLNAVFLESSRQKDLLLYFKQHSPKWEDISVLTRAELSQLINRPLSNHFPVALSYRGCVDILKQPKVAIIGSRHPSYYGRTQAQRFSRALAAQGITVLSGGAIGVDTIANSSAIEFGASCAIVGGGLLKAHPSCNSSLFSRIARSGRGIVMSEFKETADAQRWHFPRRNVTLAELCDFLLVIEAGGTSGTLITAEAALEFNRDVGALPGPVDLSTSEGTNRLIRDGAFCISHPEEVLERLNSLQNFTPPIMNGQNLGDFLTVVSSPKLTNRAPLSK